MKHDYGTSMQTPAQMGKAMQKAYASKYGAPQIPKAPKYKIGKIRGAAMKSAAGRAAGLLMGGLGAK